MPTFWTVCCRVRRLYYCFLVAKDDAAKSLQADCRSSTKAWPSGLYVPGDDGVSKVNGSTVSSSHPSGVRFFFIRARARFAAGMCDRSDVTTASRYVTAASRAVEDESANEVVSLM